MSAHSNQTGRYSRTLQEAFGPYASGQIEDPAEQGIRAIVEWLLWGLALIAGLLAYVAWWL